MTTDWKRWIHIAWLLLIPLSGTAVQPMVAGSEHTLALRNDGTVFAFGNDSFGQLGLGTLTQSPVPVQVQGLNGVAAISMGQWHALALKSDGTVWAWGWNESGQIGDGTRTVANTPLAVQGLSSVTAVSAHGNNSAALKSDGTLWAWGANDHGQLGDGTLSNRARPVSVTGISGVAKVALGGKFAVALKRDGTVWAWGRNDGGQLGDGTTTERATPAQLAGLTGITDIAVGYGHTVALKSDGTLWAWGSNFYGQLGDGTNMDRLAPVRVTALSGVVVIGAGYFHTFAVKSDGTLWAWGWNNAAQLGDFTQVDRSTPVQVGGLTGVTAIIGGLLHSVAIRADGTLWAWGLNSNGQLGDGTTVLARGSPVQVATTLTEIQSIGAGFATTMALTSDGTVWAWGSNAYGLLGSGGPTSRSVVVAVPGFGSVVKIAASFRGSLALKSDGTVWAWGSLIIDSSTVPIQVAGLTTVMDIATGTDFRIALKSDGTVWTWGSNLYGELGDGTSNDRYATPTQVTGLSGIRAIAAGGEHALALKSDGTVWAWGSNAFGEVGVAAQASCSGATANGVPCNPLAAQVPTLNGVIAIAGGDQSSVALKSDGTVWSWGQSNTGTVQLTPVQVQGLSGMVAIAAAKRSYVVALKSDGTVWAWGTLYSGFGFAVPSQVRDLSGIIAVGAGSNAAFAIKSDGTLWSWGSNEFAQIGDGTYSPRTTPVLVVNETADGALDLISEVANNIPADKIPPFFVATYKSGGLSATSLSVDVRGITPIGAFAAASDVGPLAAGGYDIRPEKSARFFLATYTSGDLSAPSLFSDISGVTPGGIFASATDFANPRVAALAAGGYNVYVAASVPTSGYFQLDASNRWSVLIWPMAEFIRGVALGSQDAVIRVNILQNVDVSPYIGTSILVGYGTSPDEMVASARYRTIFTVTQPVSQP